MVTIECPFGHLRIEHDDYKECPYCELAQMRQELERAYKQVDYLAQTFEITMKELEECKDAIEIKDRYINGHKGEMTSLNRENIQLKADLVKLRQELEECRKTIMDATFIGEFTLQTELDTVKADLARTQRAFKLACDYLAPLGNVPSAYYTFNEYFLAQADKKETP